MCLENKRPHPGFADPLPRGEGLKASLLHWEKGDHEVVDEG